MATLPLTPWLKEHLDGLSPSALHEASLQRVAEALERCRDVYPELPAPRVWFDLKGASAGQAHWGRKGLRFNPVLLHANRSAFFDEVIPHEMAHWLVFHLDKGPSLKPHGREWQFIMRELFGLAPRVTHRFDIRQAQPRPYSYRCGCQTHSLTARRHSLVQQGRRYRCRHCRQILAYDA